MFDKYLFLTPYEYVIGNAAENVFYGALTAKMKGKKLVIIVRQPTIIRRLIGNLVPARGITNKEIFNVCSDDPIIIPSDRVIPRIIGSIIDIVYIIAHFMNKTILRAANFLIKRLWNVGPYYFSYFPTLGYQSIFNPQKTRSFSWEKTLPDNFEKILADGVSIGLDRKKEISAEKIREQMGLPANCWYVALHVRELGFHNNTWEAGAYRSADINNYIEAIEHIVAIGGWVVRLGDATMKPLPNMSQVIDYPHTQFKSDLMDLYLIKNCRLYCGMDSGIWDVAHMFEKNNLIINSTNWCVLIPQKYSDLIIMKHFFSKSKGRFLSVRECLEAPFTINFHNSAYSMESDYLVVENTPMEIYEIINEKLNQSEDYAYSALQNLFVEKRRQQIEKWIVEDPFYNKWIDQSYRLATRYFYKGTAGNNYLLNNWEYGDYLENLTQSFLKNTVNMNKSSSG